MKKIISTILAIIITLSTLSVSAENQTDTISKQEMQRYCELLLDTDAVKYWELPFEKYNDNIENNLMNKNDWWEAAKKALRMIGEDGLGSVLKKEVFSATEYQNIFLELMSQLTPERNNSAMVEEMEYGIDNSKYSSDTFDSLLERWDDENQKKEIRKIYEQTHKNIEEGQAFSELFGNAVYATKIVTYIDGVFSALLKDYADSSQYIDILENILQEEANSMYELAELNQDETWKKEADNMLWGFTLARQSYENRFIAALYEIDKVFLDFAITYGSDYISKNIDKFLKDFGAQKVVNVFKTLDIALFTIHAINELTGSGAKIDASSKMYFSFPMSLLYQVEFQNAAHDKMADGIFSDEDYEYMKKLFNICRAAQEKNYEYFYEQYKNDSSQEWIKTAKEDLDVKSGKISNSAFIQGYIHAMERGLIMEGKLVVNNNNEEKSSNSQKGKCGENLFWELTEDGTLTISGNGEMYGSSRNKEDYDLYSSFKLFPGAEFEWEVKKIKKIIFSGEIKTIGSYAFNNCVNLEEIAIPESVISVFDGAFIGCKKLNNVQLHNNITDIGSRAFSGCENLKNIDLPDNLTCIAQGVFDNTAIEKLTIPENVTKIADNVFDSMKSLKEVYILTKHPLKAKIGLNDMTGGYKFTVYGYENANEWVKEMNNLYINNNMGLGAFMPQSNYINYVPLSSEMIDDKKEIIEDDQTPSIPEKEIDISKSEYLKSQEYLKALQIGTDAAMEEYIYNYGSGDMNPNIKTYANTDEYLLDIYSDETFNLNFKTAYLNENSTMQTYKNKNHYILILPDNAQDLNEGYHYLVEGDGTGFKYNSLPVGNYTAYVRSDLCNEVGGDLAQFKITVHDLTMDNIDEELAIAINFLKENGAMTGYEDGSFRPNKSMTRAEFAAIICRFTNNDIEFVGENNVFNDVFGDYWGYNYIMNAYQNGLLKGYGGGIFGCDDTLTEEQAVTVLCRMLGDTYEDVEYIETNADEKGGYSEGYISIAGERGIDIEGLQKTIPATRARVAKWLYQLYNIKNNF